MSVKIEAHPKRKYVWLIPQTSEMLVPGKIYASEAIIDGIREQKALEQVKNVACLQGITGASIAMPDIHEGYGFPIGGVAAFSLDGGIITPGGIGYDINCGVRLLLSNLVKRDIEKLLPQMVDALFARVPAGVGEEGPISLSRRELDDVLTMGASWAVKKGFGWPQDIYSSEENGAMKEADPDAVSDRAYKRGKSELGTLGSGNHFVEISYVESIYDEQVAKVFGLFSHQVVFWIHSGSRGLGHQVCTEYVSLMAHASKNYGLKVPDRQLNGAPCMSPEGRRYYSAMAAAANYAWANRQVLTHYVRQAVQEVLKKDPEGLGMTLLYDVAHNIGKKEVHTVQGKAMELMIHRKGATRAFGPGHPDIPEKYRAVGQPVLIPGDMGRGSYVLCGTEKAMQESFGTACHGAGRALSRAQAKKSLSPKELKESLENNGIYVRSSTVKGLTEEAPWAYKDVDEVVDVVDQVGLGKKVARLRPLGVIKG